MSFPNANFPAVDSQPEPFAEGLRGRRTEPIPSPSTTYQTQDGYQNHRFRFDQEHPGWGKAVAVKYATETSTWTRTFLAENIQQDFVKVLEKKTDYPAAATTAILVEKDHPSTSDSKSHFTTVLLDKDGKLPGYNTRIPVRSHLRQRHYVDIKVERESYKFSTAKVSIKIATSETYTRA